MIEIVKHREYIANFLEFVRTFLITDNPTIDEMMLVEANINILSKRIQDAKTHHVLPRQDKKD